MFGLTGGGVPRRNITLANALAAHGLNVDLLVVDARGELRASVSPSVRVFEVGGFVTRLPFIRAKRRRQFALTVKPVARYLTREKPDVLFSADNYANLAALDARSAAGVALPVVVSQRNHATTSIPPNSKLMRQILTEYPKAQAIVCVSEGVAEDLRSLGLPADKVQAIYNAVVDERFEQAALAPGGHRWMGDPAAPLLLAAGRIGPQKDFPTLLRAMKRVRDAGSPARLLILGEGKTPDARAELKAQAVALGLGEVVDMPGYVPDAVPYIAKADLFVLSSRWEGLPGVLIEALACGTPIVSTDCPSGPHEILEAGRHGALVPVGDAQALGDAILATLRDPPDPTRLKERAQAFSIGRAVETYDRLFRSLAAAAR